MNKKIVDFKTFEERLPLLNPIADNLSKDEISSRVREEEAKLIKEDEQMLLAYNNLSPHPTKGMVLYRTTTSYPDFDENLVSFFSYPNAKIARANRCNLSKHPVFYCSDSAAICINEATYNKTLNFPYYMYLSHWQVTIDKKWKIVPFVFQQLPSTNSAYEYSERTKRALVEKYKNILKESEIQQYVQLYHQEFRKENDYRFSSLVAYKFLYEDDGDIVLYPTVQVAAEGNNYAINTKHIDTGNLSLHRIDKIRIEHNKDLNLLDWYLEAIGTPDGEHVKWTTAT